MLLILMEGTKLPTFTNLSNAIPGTDYGTHMDAQNPAALDLTASTPVTLLDLAFCCIYRLVAST